MLKDELKVHNDLAASLKAGDTLETSLQNSVDSMLPKVLPSVPEGEVLYQIPKSVAKALEAKIGKPTSGVGYAFDKATDYWKSVVLYTRPKYYVNQAVGNAAMYTVSGGTPKGLVLAATKAGKAAVPEQLRIGSFHAADVPTKYYNSNDGLMKKLVVELENTAPAKGITKIRDFGRGIATNIDNYYRDAKFLDVATKVTQKKIMQQTGKRFTNSMELIERISKQADPEIIKQAIEETEKWMGDFKGMTPIERDIARRLIPFWGFTKHQLKILKNITLEDPLRGKMIETMNQVGELATPPERRDHYRNGDVYLYTDNGGTDHYLQTRYMNPLVISGFGVDVWNPILKAPMEYLSNSNIENFQSKPRTSPFVVKKENPLTNQVSYLRIVERNGKVKFEETNFVQTPLEYINEEFNPYAKLVKNIVKTQELKNGERPQTKYSMLLSKDMPEQLMSFALMNTVMDNPQLSELSRLDSFERAYKQMKTNLKKEPKLQKMFDENPDLFDELRQQYIPNDEVEMIEE